MHKRIINENSKEAFRRRLRVASCDVVKGSNNPNELYIKFTETITQIYDDCFPKTKFKIKSNNKANPWITKDIAKCLDGNKYYIKKFLKKPLHSK